MGDEREFSGEIRRVERVVDRYEAIVIGELYVIDVLELLKGPHQPKYRVRTIGPGLEDEDAQNSLQYTGRTAEEALARWSKGFRSPFRDRTARATQRRPAARVMGYDPGL